MKDQEFPYRRSLARVLIGVEDVNDHAPLFTMVMYDGQVYESAALGSAVLTVTALDKDKGQNAQITYSIDSGMYMHKPKVCTNTFYFIYFILICLLKLICIKTWTSKCPNR